MRPIVAMPFHHHASHVCEKARQMLTEAGFELRCNDMGRKPTPEELHEMIKDAFGVIAGTEKYTADVLAGCDDLKTVIRFGVGTDNFDLETMRRMGVSVGVIANYNAVAEHALMLTLTALKNMPQYEREVRAGGWGRFGAREIAGKTVGLVGFGRIGKRFAELLRPFGITLLVYDPFIKPEIAENYGGSAVTLDELLAKSDIVSLHLPATAENRHFIREETIAKMKDGAYLINTARGALVDEAALAQALTNGKLAGAGLDVYETEPVTKDNPLFAIPNTALTPHCSAITFETNYNGGITCAESIINVKNGGKPVYCLF